MVPILNNVPVAAACVGVSTSSEVYALVLTFKEP